MTDAHAADVIRIYRAGIDAGGATFETEVPDFATFHSGKIADLSFVAVGDAGDGAVLGWVTASPTSSRRAYAGVVEHSVYVDPAAQGLGIGRMLLSHLLERTDAGGYWTVTSSLFPENQASRALHAALGFREVGRRERIARQWGRWRDTILVERRSPVVD
ncbi:GNAT family N-acetyltransferase [Brevibacterium litoralis]|uniref:GNAT family N-acetyltransferase n=1 Tax=Brevibacterium litoralis TaxID=3138935 RepID=UPI0032EA90E4